MSVHIGGNEHGGTWVLAIVTVKYVATLCQESPTRTVADRVANTWQRLSTGVPTRDSYQRTRTEPTLSNFLSTWPATDAAP
jgi:hypothetical protein